MNYLVGGARYDCTSFASGPKNTFHMIRGQLIYGEGGTTTRDRSIHSTSQLVW